MKGVGRKANKNRMGKKVEKEKRYTWGMGACALFEDNSFVRGAPWGLLGA